MKLVVALAAAVAAVAVAGPANAAWTTFGDTSPGPNNDLLTANLKEVSKYTGVQGNLVRVTAYLSGLGQASGTQNVKAIVYRDSGGNPGARLGVSYEVTITAGRAFGWVTFPFLVPIPVHPSEPIWIGFIASGTSDLTQAKYTTVTGALRYNTDNYSTGPSDPFGTGTSRDKRYSLYATVDQPTIFGDTTPGGSWDALTGNQKRVAKFTATAGSVTRVSAYVSGSTTAGSQTIKAVIYSDSGGLPQALLGTSNAVTVTQNQAARWVDFTFPSPVSVSAGSLWIGFIANTPNGIARIAYTTLAGGVKWNTDNYSDGATNPFGSNPNSVNEHYTIYASLAPATPLSQRVGIMVPSIGTNNVAASYATTILNDDGLTLYRDVAPMSATYGSGSTADWQYFDRDLNFTKTVPGSMLLTFGTAPNWMHPGLSGSWYPPDSSHYGDWAAKVVEMIGHAIQNGVSVNKIELWNEPWHSNFWLPAPNPTAYEQLVTTTANAIWQIYPTMQIGISADYWEQGNVPAGTQWFQQVLNADGVGALNDSRYYFTTHNYTESDPPWKNRGTGWSFDRYSLAHDQAVAHGFTNPHVDITEYGWRAGDTSGGTNDVSVDVQAQYTIDGARQALASGYVDRVLVFEDYPGDTWGYNVHYPNGTVKPVASALKSFMSTG